MKRKKLNWRFFSSFWWFLLSFSLFIFLLSNIFLVSTTPSKQPLPTPENKKHIKILFGGDLMFDRYIRQVAQQKGNDFVFANLKDLLWQNDLVVINLEGPITHYQSVSIGSQIEMSRHFLFTFNPSLAQTLANHNIKLVNLGNNHILNFGQQGLIETRQFLTQAGVDFFGDTGVDNQFITKNIEGVKIGFVNYNQFANNGFNHTLENLRQVQKTADIIILFAHWGVEYQTTVSQTTQSLARQFIDAGVDLVVGSHPHVVQQKEIYQDKIIYYSLGNFVFDQYFSQATQKGLLVEVKINNQGQLISTKDIPIQLAPNGQTIYFSSSPINFL